MSAYVVARMVALLGAAAVVIRAASARAQQGSLSSPNDWPSYNRTLLSDRYAPQTELTPATVAALQPICTYNLGRETSFQTGPVVVDGTLYLTTDFDTIALDAATCAVRWRTTETYTTTSPLRVNRGAAVLEGRVFRGTQDGRVLAYDAATGRRIWEVTIADPLMGESVPAALIAWRPPSGRSLVFASNAGGDNKGVKGRMYALDAASGVIVWEQYLVPRAASDSARGPAAPAPTVAAGTWGNAPSDPVTGGASWTSYTLDPADATLYVPGGNPAPDFVRHLRPGANLFANTIVALDARTGAYRRHYVLTRDDFHDWDVSAAPALVTTRAGRTLLLAAPKDGHLYGFDGATGRRRFRRAVTTILNAEVPLTRRGTRFCPGTQGGSEWNGPAYSPATNLVYVGSVDWCSTVRIATDTALRSSSAGQPWAGSAEPGRSFGRLDPPGRFAGWVSAVDADKGTVKWRHRTPAPVLGGVTPTAGGIVFAGDIVGTVYAFDARTGAVRWRTDVGGAIGGGIVSYAAAGPDGRLHQRVAVTGGMTSPIWPTRKVNARLVVYGLPPESR